MQRLLIIVLLLTPLLVWASDKELNPEQYLSNGKMSLDKGEYSAAIEQLTISIDKLPILADYALYWRALAYDKMKEQEKSLSDLKAVRERYKDSPLIKQCRTKEIEILQGMGSQELISVMESYLRDYPSDYQMKFTYVQHLKDRREREKSLRLLKDIFLNTTGSLSSKALKELSEDSLSAEDLLKKGLNLNKAWMFNESEGYLKDAMKKDKKGLLRSSINEALAYSYFRQKRYKESAAIYKEAGELYWYGRSLLRARETTLFEGQIQRFLNSADKRMIPLLVAYGNIKRRNGNPEVAMGIFNDLLKRHPEKKDQETILWAIGWTNYLQRDYEKARRTFLRLKEQYGDSRYTYWLNRTDENMALSKGTEMSSIGYRDYYGYLNALRKKSPLPYITKDYKQQPSPPPLERAEILLRIGLKNDAVTEAVHTVRVSGSSIKTASASYFMQRIGNFRYSVNLISRTPYSEEFQTLLYPMAFIDEINDASKRTGLDPLLVLSIIREESRYDPEARSIAGALGLMQLMPNTARIYERQLKVNLRSSSELYDPKTNILIGTHYFKHLITTFGSLPPAIAAYNAGEDPVKEWLSNGQYKGIDEFIEDIPYDETNNYVKKVLTTYFEYIRFKERHVPDSRLFGIM